MNTRIENSMKEHDAYLSQDNDNSVDTLPPDLDQSLNSLIQELFKVSRDDPIKVSEAESAKIKNMQTGAILNEIEQVMFQHLELFEEFDKAEPRTSK